MLHLQAEGVYNQRLQNLALTLDKVSVIPSQEVLICETFFSVGVECLLMRGGYTFVSTIKFPVISPWKA